MTQIKRDIHGRYHDEQGRFVKVELTEAELESLLEEIKLRKVSEHTYERANEEFIFEEKRKFDEVFFNVSVGTLFVFVIFTMIDVFG